MPSKIVTVTTTPIKLLDINPCREQYIIQNQDASVSLYMDNTKEVSTSGTRTGRILTAMGLESANKDEDPALIGKELFGVVAAGSISVWVWEE